MIAARALRALLGAAVATPGPLGLVVEVGVDRESAEGLQHTHLLTLANVFIQGGVNRFSLGLVLSGLPRLFDKLVIQCEVRRHV